MLLCKGGIVKVFDKKNKPRPVAGQPRRRLPEPTRRTSSTRSGPAASPPPTSRSATSRPRSATSATSPRGVGRTLRFDPAAEQIVGDEEAARLLRRTYRDGHWAVPRGV